MEPNGFFGILAGIECTPRRQRTAHNVLCSSLVLHWYQYRSAGHWLAGGSNSRKRTCGVKLTMLLGAMAIVAASAIAAGRPALGAIKPAQLANDICWQVACLYHGAREFELGTDVEVRRASGGRGLGLFARRRLPAGALVTRYTGELRTMSEYSQAAISSDQLPHEYTWSLGDEWVIDAKDSSSGWARYVNHSRRSNLQPVWSSLPSWASWAVGGRGSHAARSASYTALCSPNSITERLCMTQVREGKISIPAEPYAVWFETVREIAEGEELLIDYGEERVNNSRDTCSPADFPIRESSIGIDYVVPSCHMPGRCELLGPTRLFAQPPATRSAAAALRSVAASSASAGHRLLLSGIRPLASEYFLRGVPEALALAERQL